jgi:CBS domain-containing protein
MEVSSRHCEPGPVIIEEVLSSGRGSFRTSGGDMLKAKDIMTTDVITVKEDTTVGEIGRIFIEKEISGAPVVDDDGRLLGIVTEHDLISQNSRLHIPTILRLFDAYIPIGASGRLEEEIKRMAASTVGAISTRNVVAVDEETPLEDVATIMTDRKIHLVPVVKGGLITGVIGQRDLIRGMTRDVSE